MAKKLLYYFGDKKADGNSKMKSLLGSKGVNLSELRNIGIPISPGFTLSTELFEHFISNQKKFPKNFSKDFEKSIKKVEVDVGAEFGSKSNPLLLSIVSSTENTFRKEEFKIFNLGLNDSIVQTISKRFDNERFAFDCYRRFLSQYATLVLQIDKDKGSNPFEDILTKKINEVNVESESDLNVEHLKDIVKKYKSLIKRKSSIGVPENPWEQLWNTIESFYNSWVDSEQNSIQTEKAIIIQSMVFGNLGIDSSVGYCNIRNIDTGEDELNGHFLINAQIDDLENSNRKTLSINELISSDEESFKELSLIKELLENYYKDLISFEFTIQDGKVYVLQTNVSEKSLNASIKLCVDLVHQKKIKAKDTISKIDLLKNIKELDSVRNDSLFNYKDMLDQIIDWSDKYRKLEIKARIESSEEIDFSINNNSSIGEFKTDFMFLDESNRSAFRELLFIDDLDKRSKAFSGLMPLHKLIFKDIFHKVNGKNITISLFDSGLSELVPKTLSEQKLIATELGINLKEVKKKTQELRGELLSNNLKGCRVLNLFPEITMMQTQAILEAAFEVMKTGKETKIGIMIPFVGDSHEMQFQSNIIKEVANEVKLKFKTDLNFLIGASIESPNGAIGAGKIAKYSDFISINTDCLTESTLCLDKEKSINFNHGYLAKDFNPFETINTESVGFLIKHAIKRIKKERKNIQTGICGNHCSNYTSIEFFNSVGIDFISCSPERIPFARLAATQVAIKK